MLRRMALDPNDPNDIQARIDAAITDVRAQKRLLLEIVITIRTRLEAVYTAMLRGAAAVPPNKLN